MLLGYECHQVVIYQKLHGVRDGCYLFSSKIQVMFGLWVFNSYEIGIGKDVHIDVCYLYNWTSCDHIISDSLKMSESQLIEKLMRHIRNQCIKAGLLCCQPIVRHVGSIEHPNAQDNKSSCKTTVSVDSWV